MNIVLLSGARPNYMKLLPVYENLIKLNKYNVHIIHSGQHFDYNMSTIFFKEFNLDDKIIKINLESSKPNKQIAEIMIKLEDIFNSIKPILLVVFGDVNTTLAGALTANKMNIKIAHVESGLRSFDKMMPEEINRIIVDNLSNYHFVTEQSGVDNLIKENIVDNICLVGNTMIDTLMKYRNVAEKLDLYIKYNLPKNNYILVTLHRPSNVDNNDRFNDIINILLLLAGEYKILFAVHPRIKNKINICNDNIIITEPFGYVEFLHLMIYSGIIITDAGGISEEASILNVQCLTLRESTERPITCSLGTNHLVKNINDLIFDVKKYIGYKMDEINIPLWDGNAANRIIYHMCQDIA